MPSRREQTVHKHPRLRALLLSGAMCLLGAVAAQTGPASAAASTTGAVLSTSASSPTDVWAAGYRQTADSGVKPLAENWDGSAWAKTRTRLPTGQPDGTFQSVAALAPDDVWAVGYSSLVVGGPSRTLAEHWNGRRWRIFATAEPEGSTWSALQSVTAISADDVWAVGWFYDSGDGGSVIEHWDGSTWSLVTGADPAGAYNAGLQSVSAISATNVWASGFYFDDSGAGLTLVEHWNGKKWKLVGSPDVDGSPDTELHAIAARTRRDVWATGCAFTGSTYVTVVEHWNGHQWSLVDSPNPPASSNSYLYGVDATSKSDAWATGYFYDSGSYQTFSEHWDGSTWQVVDTPDVAGGSNYLFGVLALSRHDVWAGGFAFTDHDVPFTEHWDGRSWSLVPLK